MKIIIDINCINEGDSLEAFISATSYDVVLGADNYVSSALLQRGEGSEGLAEDVFLITDNIGAKNRALAFGIGMAVYITPDNDASRFSEALYCIETLKDMTDDTLLRMYQRAAGIPWLILETDRCLVREITVEDVDRLYEIYADEDVRRYVDNLYENREDEIQYTRDYISSQYRFFEYGLWIVVQKETGTVIGRAGIFDRENQDLKELGFVFSKDVWGQGIASEVLTAVMDYAGTELSVETLCANVQTGNDRSYRLLFRLGFEKNEDKIIDGKKYINLVRRL